MDENNNILSGGRNELDSMKNTLVKLEKSKAENAELTEKEAQLEKQISALEKGLAEKTASVIKMRKAEMEADYDKQLEAVKSRQKKVRSKREKQKNSKVSERIEAETRELQEESVHLKEEIRGLYQGEKIPKFLNCAFFHAIYQPVRWKDILIIVLALAVVLFVIPYGIYHFFLTPKISHLVITYIVTVLVFGGFYLFLGWMIKEKHQEVFKKTKEARKLAVKNQHQARIVERKIRKDKDESGYGLDKFNEELSELEQEYNAIIEEKKNAVKRFEIETRKVIADELAAEVADELSKLRRQHDDVYRDQRAVEEQIKSLSIVITDRYNPYIGKENMSITLLDQLGQILEANEAATIGEALNLYRSRKETEQQG